MSLCFNHLRRTLGTSSTVGKRICATTALSSSSNTLAPVTAAAPLSDASTRNFAAAAAAPKKSKKGGKAAPKEAVLSYKERKVAAKQTRRERYDSHQSRLGRLKTRRDGSPKDVKKNLFRSWYDNEMIYHDQLCRQAKRENKPWRIRVAAMVERLPVVIPDMEEWEREYKDLSDYLLTYGKEYPEETGFMYAMDKPEDHIVPTDEELLAGLPFTPAPRETEHDATGNYQTLERELKTRVYLAVKSDKEGNKSGPRWTLPSALADDADIGKETLLQVAERAVKETVGGDLTLWCPSNTPMNVNCRKYNTNLPEEFRGNYFGEKIFYYRVQYDSGDADENKLNKENEDWGWLTREEVVGRVEGERGKHQAKFFHYML